jgi:hypothetical protein
MQVSTQQKIGLATLESIDYYDVDRFVSALKTYRETWSDEDYVELVRSLNTILERVGAHGYYPLVLEELSSNEILPLWSINLDLDVIKRLIVSTLKAKMKPGDYCEIAELKRNLEDTLRMLGVEEASRVVNLCNTTKHVNDCLIYTSILTLIYATNP